VRWFGMLLFALAGFAAMIPLVQVLDWGGIPAGALAAGAVAFAWSSRTGDSTRSAAVTAASVVCLSCLVAVAVVVYVGSQLDFNSMD
jgi:hypothetical protein